MNDGPPAVASPWTNVFVAGLAAGTVIVGARFHPGSAAEVLGLPVFGGA